MNPRVGHWLMKSEPEVYSIEDLEKDGKTFWEGVRNYQARNFMTQQMKVGDWVLFYHSNSDPSAIVGLAKVSQEASVDPTQFDRKSVYFDEKATKDKPIWFGVEIEFHSRWKNPLTLQDIKKLASRLKNFPLLQKGQRLSVMPVSPGEFSFLLSQAESVASFSEANLTRP